MCRWDIVPNSYHIEVDNALLPKLTQTPESSLLEERVESWIDGICLL